MIKLPSCRGLKLDYILNTHHHWDHTGGNEELKSKFHCTIVGPKADKGRIPGIDVALADGESWQFGDLEMQVFDTPGHTRGHITLWFPQVQALFPGGNSCLHARRHELSAASMPELAYGDGCCLQVQCISGGIVWHACLSACWLADLFCCCLEAVWRLLVALRCHIG